MLHCTTFICLSKCCCTLRGLYRYASHVKDGAFLFLDFLKGKSSISQTNLAQWTSTVALLQGGLGRLRDGHAGLLAAASRWLVGTWEVQEEEDRISLDSRVAHI